MASLIVRKALQGPARMSLALAFLALGATTALGQVPQPRVADVNARSGLISRFAPIEPNLPRDPYRDVFYDTRWADYPQVVFPNCYKHNGLYGLRWNGACTQCNYPYFYGSPGQDTLKQDCLPARPLFRLVQNLFQPWRPVGMYYASGCFVPVYDLDPLVSGPGPNPIPWFNNWYKGG